MSELNKALSKAQGEFPVIPKTRTVTKYYKDKNGQWKEYQYKYANVDDILKIVRPILSKHGLSIEQSIANGICTTRVKHDSGEFSDSYCPVFYETNDMQKLGAAITYVKRYGLSLALCISTDDDLDANDITDEPFKVESKKEIVVEPQADFSEPIVENHVDSVSKPAPYGETIVPFGKYKGKALNTISIRDAKGAIDWAKSKGKFTDFATKGTLFLQEQEIKTSDLIPDFNQDDPLPF